MKTKEIAKKCKECEKLLRQHNKSGLCNYHRMVRWQKENRK